jgi:hypothetical protein
MGTLHQKNVSICYMRVPSLKRPRSKVSGRFVSTKQQIWDAFFSQGIGLNLAPRLPKNSSRTNISNVARMWACANLNSWSGLYLGDDLCSDQFSKWLRTNKLQEHYQNRFDEYEHALRREFINSPGITGYGIVYRGMPGLPPRGLRDKSPMSVTRRVRIADVYTRRGNRRNHQIVAILLNPGTKLLRIGGVDGEYLLPPGTVKPSGSPRSITRFETKHANDNLEHVKNLMNWATRKRPMSLQPPKKPFLNPHRVVVVPAIFVPDPRWR